MPADCCSTMSRVSYIDERPDGDHLVQFAPQWDEYGLPIAFALVFAVQTSQFDSLGGHIFSGTLVAAACLGVGRAWLMGTVTVDERQVWARSFYRSRRMLRSEVDHFEAEPRVGGHGHGGRTLKVVPTARKSFRIGELFDRQQPGKTSSVEELAATLNRTLA